MSRKYDIMISANYSGELIFNFDNKAVTGIIKLAQRFMIQLLTVFGSKVSDKESGTILLRGFENLSISEKEFSHYVSISVSEVLSNMLEKDIDNDYSDEQIKDAVVTYVKKTGLAFEVKIDIYTESDSTSIILPIGNKTT